MSGRLPARLSKIERGEAADEIELVDTSGGVTILHAHGVDAAEQFRTRELARRLLLEALTERAKR